MLFVFFTRTEGRSEAPVDLPGRHGVRVVRSIPTDVRVCSVRLTSGGCFATGYGAEWWLFW
jgi:hypothetical protein